MTPYQRAKGLLRDTYRWAVPRWRPKIMRTFPHDEAAFTQGLAYENGIIYESTGLDHASSLRCVDVESGAVLRKIDVPNDWAEGVAVDDQRVIQLSWKRGVATVFAKPALERIGSYSYDGEGWGLTSAPTGFIMSDGSSALQFRGEDFVLQRKVKITNCGIGVRRLNDLAYANGKIFANLWYRDDIVRICAETGKVEAILDCSELRSIAAPGNAEHVLNGIAFRQDRASLILTGKCWRWFFEVALEP
jgi:glutamine cyclotransferase